MNALVCGVCGHVALEGDAPEKCPVCGAPKTAFSEKVVNTSESEGPGEKHLPVIKVVKACSLVEADCMEVGARVGSVLHPMEAEHYIVWVDFYVDKKWVMRAHLAPGCNPAASAHLKSTEGKISVVELCNVHGLWLSEVK